MEPLLYKNFEDKYNKRFPTENLIKFIRDIFSDSELTGVSKNLVDFFRQKLKEIINDENIKEFIKDTDELKYYEPLILTFVYNLFIHIETLEWISKEYNQKTPTFSELITKIGNVSPSFANLIPMGITWLGFGEFPITNDELINKEGDKISKLSEKWVVDFVISKIKKQEIPKILIPIIHASLINYFMYPDTLEYVMTKYFPGRTDSPTLIRHQAGKQIYKYRYKIFIGLVILTYIINLFTFRKNIYELGNRTRRRSKKIKKRFSKKRFPKRRFSKRKR